MNQKKLNNYKLTASIHTLSIKSNGIIQATNNTDYIKTFTKFNDNPVSKSKINVNKLMGDVFTYQDFLQKFQEILDISEIKEYLITRADFRLDSYDKKHYEEYTKLNKYLISMLAVAYTVENVYRTENLFSQKQLSIAIKNRYFETENYDREAKNKITKNYNEPAKSRLEERSIRSKEWDNNDLKQEFMQHWFSRWEKAVKNKCLVHKRYNDELEKIYKENKNAFPCQFRSLTDFLIQYQNCIFCKEQMIDLLSRFEEVKNPKQRAKNHKTRYGMEYFSNKDIQVAIHEIKRATKEFFSN